jgi:hypothetical protein
MAFLDTVRCPLSGEIVALHHARETTPLADADDINTRDTLEGTHGNLLSDFDALGAATQFPNELLRLTIGFRGDLDTGCDEFLAALASNTGDVAALSAAGLAGPRTFVFFGSGLVEIAQLDRFVTVAFDGTNLQHGAGTCLNDRYRCSDPRFGIEYLGHTDLAAKDSLAHFQSPDSWFVVGLLLPGDQIQSTLCRRVVVGSWRRQSFRQATVTDLTYPASFQFI